MVNEKQPKGWKPEFDSSPVREVDKKPVSELAKTIAMVVAAISRINTIEEAKKQLNQLKEAEENQNQEENKDIRGVLAEIVGRLVHIGQAPKGLQMRDIEVAIARQRPDEIIVLLEEFAKTGKKNENDSEESAKTGRENNNPVVDELVGKARELLKKTKGKKNVDAFNVDEEQAKLREMVREQMMEVDEGEKTLMEELEPFVDGLEDVEEVKSFIKKMMGAGLFSVARRKELVGNLKAKVANAVNESDLFKNKDKEVSWKDFKDLAKKFFEGNGLDGLAEIALKAKANQARVSRFGTLLDGFQQIDEGLQSGLDIREVARRLKPEQMRELRRFLSSSKIAFGKEKPKNVDKIPNFDADYVDFVEKLGLSEEDRSGLMLMISAIDSEYVEPWEYDSSERAGAFGRNEERRRARELYEQGSISGNGVEHLLNSDPEVLEQMADVARERMGDLYEEIPDGGFRERSYEEQLKSAIERAKKRQAEINSSREVFLNIDMQRVFELLKEFDEEHMEDAAINPHGFSLYEMIDYEYWLDYKVCKLTEEARNNPEKKAYFEKWWFQTASYEVRRNAYEGQFDKRQASSRMILFNSLNEIVGVGTDIKGLLNWRAMSFSIIDRQNNSLVNDEMFMGLAKFWAEQGVDFRLEDKLKQHREEMCLPDEKGERGKSIGSFSLFEAVTFLQLTLDDDIRRQFGVPDWQKEMTYGTLLYKYSDQEMRGKVTEAIWTKFLTAEVGIGLGLDISSLTEAERTTIMNMYSTELHLAMNYATTHQILNTMIGDASFDEAKIELPGALAEGHLKQDDILYRNLFLPRFNFLGDQFKELYAYFDSGLRDYVAMAKEDYAGHLQAFNVRGYEKLLELEKHINEADEEARKVLEQQRDDLIRALGVVKSGNGAPTILLGLLGKQSAEQVTRKDLSAAYEIKQIMDKSLWHYGIEVQGHHGGHHEAVNDFNVFGVPGELSTAYRRRAQDIRKQLMENLPSQETLERIDWSFYVGIVKNPKIAEYLLGNHTAREKWMFFAKTFGEYSFDHSSAATKRMPDFLIKYAIEYRKNYMAAFRDFTNDPFNKGTIDKLNDIPRSLNQAAAPHLMRKRVKGLMSLAEPMGPRFFGGGSARRIKRGKDNSVSVEKKRRGANGLPIIETEVLVNDSMPWSLIKKRSVAESLGYGVPTRDWWMEFLWGMFREGLLTEEQFKHWYRELEFGVFKEPKLGPIANAWRYLNMLEPFIEYLAPKLGLTGHELKNILFKHIDDNLSKVSKHILGFDAVGTSGGGHY